MTEASQTVATLQENLDEMIVSIQSFRRAREREEVIGRTLSEAQTELMNALSDVVGLATVVRDLSGQLPAIALQLREEVAATLSRLDARLEALQGRFEGIDGRLTVIETLRISHSEMVHQLQTMRREHESTDARLAERMRGLEVTLTRETHAALLWTRAMVVIVASGGIIAFLISAGII